METENYSVTDVAKSLKVSRQAAHKLIKNHYNFFWNSGAIFVDEKTFKKIKHERDFREGSVSAKEFAEATGFKKRAIYYRFENGEINGYKTKSNKIRIWREEIRRYRKLAKAKEERKKNENS